MGLDPVTIGYLATAVVGTAVSYDQNKRSMAAQEESQEISSAQQKSEAIRARRQSARQARVRRAQIEQAAANTGTGGSSGELGAVSAIASQQAGVASYFAGSEVAASAISAQNQRAADSAFRSQLAGQVANLAYGVAQDPNQQKFIKNIFSGE